MKARHRGPGARHITYQGGGDSAIAMRSSPRVRDPAYPESCRFIGRVWPRWPRAPNRRTAVGNECIDLQTLPAGSSRFQIVRGYISRALFLGLSTSAEGSSPAISTFTRKACCGKISVVHLTFTIGAFPVRCSRSPVIMAETFLDSVHRELSTRSV